MSSTRPLILLLAALSTAHAQQTTWKLVWSDEFNGPANSPPSSQNWNYDLGGGGWGNGEQETYTNSTQNVFQDGLGHLVIRAIRDSSGNFTSGRIRTGMTQNSDTANLSWQYGRIEARIKLPFGPGVWPAFWMLGSNITTVPWPGCGEIDILENFGANKDNISTVHATLHGPPAGSNFAGTGVSTPYTLPNPQTISNSFHIYAVEWAPNSITFSVDGTAFRTLTPASLPSGAQWVFNHPFFLILNLAIGGPTTFLGTPTPSTPFPQDMLVDYVRVYQSAPLAAGTPAISPGGIVNAASSLTSLAAGALATIYGQNLADATYSSQLFTNGAFSTTTPSGVSVTVNGANAPLTYVSPNQINFQIPWESALAPNPVNVAVARSGTSSDPVAITVNPTAPAVFLNPSTGVAILSSCAAPSAGATCTLWGTGLGPKNAPSTDGVPFAPTALQSMETSNACTLTIAGQPAAVAYCGAAPGLVIDQINFVYPSNIPTGAPVPATLTVAGHSGTFLIPPPAN